MRILVLAKRHYMSKDMLLDQYGRFYSIPEALSASGADVRGVCLAYRPVPDDHPILPCSVPWQSFQARKISTLAQYFAILNALLREWRPDVIWATSDSMHVALGVMAQSLYGIPCVADLYDHFDAYPANRIPGISFMYHRAVRHAAGVSCISEPLANWADQRRNGAKHSLVLENAIEGDLFRPLDSGECRRQFGLSGDRFWVGTAGALNADRGIGILYDALDRLYRQDRKWGLAIAGPRNVTPPDMATDLGMLPHSDIPRFLGALNVGIVCNRDNLFARYCFPQKLYEMLACGLPVVAARVGVLASPRSWPGTVLTYGSDSPAELAEQIARAVKIQKSADVERPPDWMERARELLGYFDAVVCRPDDDT